MADILVKPEVITEEDLSVVGKSVKRLDGMEKVLGKAVYVHDMNLPDMLHAKVLRSTRPHALIKSIHLEKAWELPGVKAIITGKDVPGNRFGAGLWDQPLMASDLVRYIGEPVAAVAAESLEIAEEALALIDVVYEDLPAVFDVEESFAEDTPVVIHPELAQYGHSPNMKPKLIAESPNTYQHHIIRSGNLEEGFEQADLVIENRYTTAMIHHVQMEPHCAIARAEVDGSITVWASTGTITAIRNNLAKIFGLPVTRIHLIVPYVGGQFGGRQDLQCAGVATALSMVTQRAVKFAFTREEMFHCATVRCPSIIYMKDGVKKDGTLVARKIKMLQNGGAYADYGFLTVRNSLFVGVQTYRIPNFEASCYGVYTNLPKSGPYRGFGNEQINWAIENQMDIIAEKLALDPVELRRKNLLHEGDISPAGEDVFSIGVEECLQKVVEGSGYDYTDSSWEEGDWLKGIGVAIGSKYSLAPSASCATVRACEDGTLDVYANVEENGQGAITALAQIAAEEMDMELSDVRILGGDTNFTPYDEGAISSRMTYMTGNAIRLACRNLKERLYQLASIRLDAEPQELLTGAKKIFVKADPSRFIHISDLFRFNTLATGKYIMDGGELIGRATSYQGCTPQDENGCGKRINAFYTHGAQAVQVAVHKKTGRLKVEKIFSAFDMGKAVNPLLCCGQIEGGVTMGLGSTIMEEVVFDDQGKVLSNFTNYLIPTALDLPETADFVTYLVEAYHRDGPFGAKGLGEGTLVAIAPAINQAIYRAVGVRSYAIPIRSEDIMDLLDRE